MRTQIDFSLEAVKAGGFWGKGIGQGTLKIRMPEVHGDFVFASFVEESGFLGVLLYLALIGVFAGMGSVVAWKSSNRFIQILAFGLVTPIVIQTLLNIAVVVHVIPTTGVPLPFVSSGGSSLLVTLCAAALLVNITRRHIKSEGMGGEYAR
jgi:cell division protein FtsW